MRKYLALFVVVVLTILSSVDSQKAKAKKTKDSASLSLLTLKKKMTVASTSIQVAIPKLQEIVNFNLMKVFMLRKKIQILEAKNTGIKTKDSKNKQKLMLKIDHNKVMFDKTKQRIAVFRALKKVMFKIKADSLEGHPMIKRLEECDSDETSKLNRKLKDGVKKMFANSSKKVELRRRLAISNKCDKVLLETNALVAKLSVGEIVFEKIKFAVIFYHKIMKKIGGFLVSKNYYKDKKLEDKKNNKLGKMKEDQHKEDNFKGHMSRLNRALDYIDKKADMLAIKGGKKMHIKVSTQPNICYSGCKRMPEKSK